jgi:4-alpha-glucanotransferase
MNKNRNAGILLPVFSLPSKYGIGTFGSEAYNFVDFLKKARVGLWQILPLNVTSYGDSPYQSPSSYALNYYFIDLDILNEQGLLKKKEYQKVDLKDTDDRVNYAKQYNNRIDILRLAFSRFDVLISKFQKFIKTDLGASDFAFFMVLKQINNGAPWYQRNDEYRNYSIELEAKIIHDYTNDYLFYLWTQFEAQNEYFKLRKYANKKGIKIMGDMPIYVAYDSVEAYKYPQLFQFNDNREPCAVAGCPPDCFSIDGQLWGNPLRNWDYLKETNFKWYRDRIFSSLKLFDLLRIDHFRGFSGYYSIPYGDKTARNGHWVKGPGAALFDGLHDLPIVAEDLGLMDNDFYKMFDECGFPGMKIVTQCFDDDNKDNCWRPSNYTHNFFSYTATHDSQTTMQFIIERDQKQRKLLIKILNEELLKVKLPLLNKTDNKSILDGIIDINFQNNADVAVVPLQDLLYIGKEGRMNFPSTLSTNNWSYRVNKSRFLRCEKTLIERLKKIIKISNR